MNYIVIALLSFSIYLSGIVGFMRFNNVDKTYYPFIYFIWLSCLNEAISFLLMQFGFHTVINNNIFVLISSLTIVHLFKNLHTFNNSNFLYSSTLATLTSVWIFETFIYTNIFQISSYFRILSSFVLVLLSINTINKLLISYYGNLLKNATFLICIAFTLLYTIKVVVETFWLYASTFSNEFLSNLFSLLIIVSLLTNLIYILIVAWIPMKRASLLQQ